MSPGADRDDVAHLARAIELAARGPQVDPNPRVGAVITDATGAVVGRGWHRGAGTPHAEVVALAEAGALARGGTAYVSLEPCHHHGRTGPCTEALLHAGVARVVAAQRDPHPLAGGGLAALEAAGVDALLVEVAEAAELNRRWAIAMERGRPYVTWKVATTLDGRVAAADGTSRWITGPASRADVHRLRATAGAIVVGTGTVLADDPSLTVRDDADAPIGQQPLRVVVGGREIPQDATLRADDQWWQSTSHDPAAVLNELHARQIRHVWLEGGPTVAAGWLRAGVIDEVVAYLAPALLGAGRSLIGDLGIDTIADTVRWRLCDVTQLDQDVRLTMRPNRQEA